MYLDCFPLPLCMKQDLFSEIDAKYLCLEDLEKCLCELTFPYPRSVAILVLESDVASFRSQWEELSDRAKALDLTLSEQVSQWNLYQKSVQEISTWLNEAEKRLKNISDQACDTLQDVQQCNAQVQVRYNISLSVSYSWGLLG